MNHSITTADRNTHFKIVALALIAEMAVLIVGVCPRSGDARRGPSIPYK